MGIWDGPIRGKVYTCPVDTTVLHVEDDRIWYVTGDEGAVGEGTFLGHGEVTFERGY